MKKLLAVPMVLAIVVLQFPFGTPVAEAEVSSWIKSASVIPQSNTEFASDHFKQSARNFQAAGGNYINFIIPYYQGNSGSSDINPGWNTPTDSSLISGIQFVHSLGMKVQLSIYLETYSGEWRANINAGDRNTWFQRYGDVLVKYGQMASQQGVELYQLGAELISMASPVTNGDNTARWYSMISRVRGVYSGALTYSANRPQFGNDWASEAAHIGFWDKMNYLGLSAYYELYGDGSVQSLKNNWSNLNSSLISQLSQYGKPILFTEIGYRSVSGAHERPWDSGSGGGYDPQLQSNLYTALFDYWNGQSSMVGVVLWWWSADPNYGGSGNIDYTPQNKPAQDVLRQWWTGGTSPPPSSGPVAFTASGSAEPSSASTGQNVTLAGSIQNTTGPASGVVVDLEVYNGGTKVFQKFYQDQNFSNGETKQFSEPWTPSGAGEYVLKIGVFNGNWSQNYAWNDRAAVIAVGTGSTPPPSGPVSFSVSGGANPSSPSVGQNTTLSASVQATGSSVSDAVVDLEIYGTAGRVFQFFTGGQNFAAGQTRQYTTSWSPSSAGTYTLKAGIFSGDWSSNYSWHDSVFSFTVGSGGGSTPPPPPPSQSGDIVMVNGYPTVNGNYIDCNGTVDNDPSHHTTDPNDADPAHHVGQNCPAGSLVGPR